MKRRPPESSPRLLHPISMASATATDRNHPQPSCNNFFRFVQSTASNLSTFLAPKTPSLSNHSSKVVFPILFDSTVQSLYPPHVYSSFDTSQPDSLSSKEPRTSSSLLSKDMSSNKVTGFPSTVKLSGLKSADNGGGPAFVGQVFSMCDLSGTGLMAVSTHFDIPFISERTPEWLKKMFAAVTKSERDGPVFRFFMDLGDAVSYVKKLNIPSGVVGACRLDLAYEHFKEKPNIFQFVPNEKQVKEANKLLKVMSKNGGKKKVEGVPVFSAQNLDIAIATTNGIKWYTPYFFDKNMLDKILEESVDKHFHSMIQTRHLQRRREVIDDDAAGEMIEEMGDSMLELPEVREVLEEVGLPEIPWNVLSKAVEIQLHYALDSALLGNRWLRKVIGIQPKFPYMVDSFEKRSAASFLRTSTQSNLVSTSELESDKMQLQGLDTTEDKPMNRIFAEQGQNLDLRFAFGDWLGFPWLKKGEKLPSLADKRGQKVTVEPGPGRPAPSPSPFLPKVTMVGISTAEAGWMSKANLNKAMEDMTKELEGMHQPNHPGTVGYEGKCEERDPLFVANVGDPRKRFNLVDRRGAI